jgi:hypothetical protein
MIFVLTKTAVVGQECTASWEKWIKANFTGAQVVSTESYRRKQGDTERKGQGK